MARVRSLVRTTSLQTVLAQRNAELERTLDDLKQAEVRLVQSERLAAVGELAAGIAHEANNPINFALNAVRALSGHVRDLREFVMSLGDENRTGSVPLEKRLECFRSEHQGEGIQDLADALLELSEMVGEGLKRTSSLVGDLREFARPGHADSRICSGVDVAVGLASTLRLVSYSLQAQDVEVDVRVDEGLPHIVADSGALNQVMLNLVKNAIEAFSAKGGKIRIELCQSGDDLVIHIADNGPGIPPKDLPSVFEPFFTTRESSGGTGLGLAISQRIVSAHDGTLSVESESTQGTRFTIRLPITGPRSVQAESLADSG